MSADGSDNSNTETGNGDCTCQAYTTTGGKAIQKGLTASQQVRGNNGALGTLWTVCTDETDVEDNKFEAATKAIKDYEKGFPNCLHSGGKSTARPSFMLRQRLRADARMAENPESLSRGLMTSSAPLLASRLLRIGGRKLLWDPVARHFVESQENSTTARARMWTTFVQHDVIDLLGLFEACNEEVKVKDRKNSAPVENVNVGDFASSKPATAFLALPPPAVDRQTPGDQDSWSFVGEKILNGLATADTSKVQEIVDGAETTAADTSSITSEKVRSSAAPVQWFMEDEDVVG